MKNNFILDLLPWVGLPLLLASLIAWGIAPAYPGDAVLHAAPKPAAKAAAAKAANNVDAQELKERLKELEDAARQIHALELDGQHKQVDWWLTFLGVLAAIMAILGGLIPYLMGRKDKEIIEQDKAQIRQMLTEIKGMQADAASSVEKIHQAEKTLTDYASGTPAAEDGEKIRAAVKTVEQDEDTDYILRLRAEAVAASEVQNASKAYALWAALAELAPNDASAQFNAGYWAHEYGDSTQGAEKLHWLRLTGKHYAQALGIKPDDHKAASNWGVALADEARARAATDADAAYALWKQAREKFQQALKIKPDKHEAASNWGLALADEAKARAATDADAAYALSKQAEEKYQQRRIVKHRGQPFWIGFCGGRVAHVLRPAMTCAISAASKGRRSSSVSPTPTA